jgi:hypothetical protein
MYSRINSIKLLASGAGNVSVPRLMSQIARVRVDQCVSVIRVVEVPVLVCLRGNCNHVTEVGGAVRFVRF